MRSKQWEFPGDSLINNRKPLPSNGKDWQDVQILSSCAEAEKRGTPNEGTDNSSKVHAISEVVGVLHLKYSVDKETSYV